MSSSSTIITPRARLSYPHLDKPQPSTDGKAPKFSATLVFSAGADLRELQDAAMTAAKAEWGTEYKGRSLVEAFRVGDLRSPFRRDWEKKGYEKDSTFINARTLQAPQCAGVDSEGRPFRIHTPLEIQEAFYPGCWVRASVKAFAYKRDGNAGVAFALNNIQKLGEGERLDSRLAAEDEFGLVQLADGAATDLSQFL